MLHGRCLHGGIKWDVFLVTHDPQDGREPFDEWHARSQHIGTHYHYLQCAAYSEDELFDNMEIAINNYLEVYRGVMQ